MMPDTPRTYTRAELRAGDRPRVRKGETYRVAAAPRGAGYVVTSPCCGVGTTLPNYAIANAARLGLLFDCGKPWSYVRGRPRGGGCRARYTVTVVEPAAPPPPGQDPRPEAFDLTWTGQ